MAKKVNKKEIAEKAFEAYKSAKSVFVADDGNCFLTKNAADLHKNTNPSGKKVGYTEFQNPEASTEGEETDQVATGKAEDNPEKRATAPERIEMINAMETVEQVEAALKGESAVTVKAAGEKRIKFLEGLNAVGKGSEEEE